MSKATDYEKRAEELIVPITDEHGFELVDVEYVKESGNFFLRAYIDKPGGITIDDCEIVSRALSAKLDEKDFIEDAYILEVSSPGLGRPLKKDKDFVRHEGDEVDVKLYKAFTADDVSKGICPEDLIGEKEFSGILTGHDATSINIKINENTTCKIDRKAIAKIALAFDF